MFRTVPTNATFPWMPTGLALVSSISTAAQALTSRHLSPGLFYLLVPVALLCALFCARLGVERGRTATGGILPSWLFFCAWLLGMSWLRGRAWDAPVDAPAFGWLLLAAFAVLRADPPAPGGVGLGWTLAAGVLGALCIVGRMDALGSVGGLGLYVWWSSGWRRAAAFGSVTAGGGGIVLASAAPWHEPAAHALPALYLPLFFGAALLGYGLRRRMPPTPPPVYGPELPGTLPMAYAHRMIGGLLFIALMGIPAAAGDGWEFIAYPLGMAASLTLTSLLALRL